MLLHNKKLIKDFMDGYCDILAIEVYYRLNLPIISVIEDATDCFQHALTKLPNGTVIDASLVFTPKQPKEAYELTAKKFNIIAPIYVEGFKVLNHYRKESEFCGDYVPKYSQISTLHKQYIEEYIQYLVKTYNLKDTKISTPKDSTLNVYKYVHFTMGMVDRNFDDLVDKLYFKDFPTKIEVKYNSSKYVVNKETFIWRKVC